MVFVQYIWINSIGGPSPNLQDTINYIKCLRPAVQLRLKAPQTLINYNGI